MIENEKILERKLCKKIKELGGHAYKFVSPNQRGVPDRLCALPNGVVFFVELKTTGKKPTKLQMLAIKELTDLGLSCEVADSTEKINNIIEYYAKRK
jgi:Holliday junction resolvase